MPTRLARQAAPLAAIDIGSHSFRLEIARVTNAGYRPLLGLKETVRLGAGLDAQGHIDNAAIGRGLAAQVQRRRCANRATATIFCAARKACLAFRSR